MNDPEPNEAESAAMMVEWDTARDKSWAEYEAFVQTLKGINDPELVAAYERDGDDDRENCYLSSLWVALCRWKFIGTKTFRSGGKRPLRLPPRSEHVIPGAKWR